MFERKKYKSFAKKQLAGRWSIPVFITVIVSIVSLIFSRIQSVQIKNSGYMDAALAGDIDSIMLSWQTMAFPMFSSSFIEMIVMSVFSIATIGVYLKMSRSPEPVHFGDFVEGFNNWARAILGTLWQALWVFLWSLLLFIPGIIKSIAYSQMFYLIVEYKDLSVTKAMKISMKITNGHKWDLFVMHLSFLGWLILSVFTLGILDLWLVPYMNMTYVNAYHALLKEAIENGVIKPEDLSE